METGEGRDDRSRVVAVSVWAKKEEDEKRFASGMRPSDIVRGELVERARRRELEHLEPECFRGAGGSVKSSCVYGTG